MSTALGGIAVRADSWGYDAWPIPVGQEKKVGRW